jgi:MFS family permease
MDYTLGIFVADTSSLKNRGFTFAYIASLYIVTTWLGGPLATAFLNGLGFRWGFGVFAIIEPLITMPLFGLFIWNYRNAKKAGIMPVSHSGRTTVQSIKHYIIEFDLAHIVLLCVGMALFLLPFSLYSYQPEWLAITHDHIMIIFGGLFLIAFSLYEQYMAPKTFIPYELLTDQTVLGAIILAAILFVEFYLWDNYFSSFLQVVNGLTITEASQVIYNRYHVSADRAKVCGPILHCWRLLLVSRRRYCDSLEWTLQMDCIVLRSASYHP